MLKRSLYCSSRTSVSSHLLINCSPDALYDKTYKEIIPRRTGIPFFPIFYSYSTKATPVNILINEIVDLINENKPLTTENKKLFRKYWNNFSSIANSNIPVNKDNYNVKTNIFKETIINKVDFSKCINFIKENRLESSTSRGLYRRELLYNIKNKDLIKNIIIELDPSTQYSNSLDFTNKSEIFYWCLNDCINTNDYLMAIDLYLEYYSLYPDCSLDEKLASRLLSTISFNDPKFNYLHLEKYLALTNLLKQKKSHLILSNFQFYSLYVLAHSLNKSPLLKKETLRELMDAELENHSDANRLDVAYSLIKMDCKMNNASGVYVTWLKIKNYCDPVTKHDPRIIFDVFRICNKNKAYRKVCSDILSILPSSYICNNPMLLPEVINYISKIGSLKLARTIIQDMRLFTTIEMQELLWSSKIYLSALFKMQLKFQDYENSNETTKRIEELFGSLSSADYLVIAEQILDKKSTENIIRAIKLLDSLPISKSFSIYPVVINKLLKWKMLGEMKSNDNILALINEILTKANQKDPRHDLPLWDYISAIYIKSLVNTTNVTIPSSNLREERNSHYKKSSLSCTVKTDKNLDMVKFIYLRSSASNNSTLHIVHYNPWSAQSPDDIYLKLTKRNRLIILRTIAYKAIQLKREDIFAWCCSVMNTLGLSVEELKIDWNIRLQSKLRRNIPKKSEILEQQLELSGIGSIQRLLKK